MSDPNPAQLLAAAQRRKERALDLERHAVLEARRQGWSWQKIANQLGISQQATTKKYAALAAADQKATHTK